MKHRNKIVSMMIAIVLFSTSSHATKWRDKKVDDPIKPGSKCDVKAPQSWGGYIYYWPSRFDQVFWPHLVRNGIWFCKESGFIAFMDDFKISEKEKKAISKYLKKNYKPWKADPEGKEIFKIWSLLESVYKLRGKSKAFENRFLRMRATVFEIFDDTVSAEKYRRKALTQIKVLLTGNLSYTDRLRYIYIASNYERQFGNTAESDKYIKVLQVLVKSAASKKEKGFAKYISGLSKETKWIKPGGGIIPDRFK